MPEAWLLPSLTGTPRLEPRGDVTTVRDFHVFGAEVTGFPWRCEAEALIAECGELLGRAPSAERIVTLAQQTARPDLFREAARHLGIAVPPADRRQRQDAADPASTGHAARHGRC